MLIRTTKDIREYCPSVTAQTNFEEIRPSVRHIEENLLIPAIGQSLYDKLNTQLTEGTENEALAKLLSKTRETVSYLSVLAWLPFAAVKVGNKGINRLENSDGPTAFKYQETDLKQSLRQSGLAAMERLLLFLDSKRSTYPDWESTATAKNMRGNLINTTAEFSACYPIDNSPVIFMAIRPYMAQVEDFEIKPALGTALYGKLKAAIKAGDLTEAQTELLETLQKAIAFFTAASFSRRSGMTITDRGYFFKTVEAQTNSPDAQSLVDSQSLLPVILSDEGTGRKYLKQALEYIGSHAEGFPEFAQTLPSTINYSKPRKIQPFL
jgi:hypothetical protein